MNAWAGFDEIKRRRDSLKMELGFAGFDLMPADHECNYVAKNRQRTGEVLKDKTVAGLLVKVSMFRQAHPLKTKIRGGR